MTSLRKTALVAGVCYLTTFVSIPTLALYRPVKNDPGYIIGVGGSTGVLWGGLLEVIVALAGIGTAVMLYPVVKRQNQGAALGFVAARILEAGMIFTGVLSLLSLVTLRQNLGRAAGANAAALVTTGAASGWSSRASGPARLRLTSPQSQAACTGCPSGSQRRLPPGDVADGLPRREQVAEAARGDRGPCPLRDIWMH